CVPFRHSISWSDDCRGGGVTDPAPFVWSELELPQIGSLPDYPEPTFSLKGTATMITSTDEPSGPAEFNLSNELDALNAFRETFSGASVGVVYGPKSLEDRYYLEHAPREQLGVTALVTALRRLDFLVTQIDPTSETFLAELCAPDLLFLNLHGE